MRLHKVIKINLTGIKIFNCNSLHSLYLFKIVQLLMEEKTFMLKHYINQVNKK